uniref:At1g61320/AtMIF1 LRR domain-containing protein n=1 Tax=Hordeum vulgare subsp. vulgare TaxID=112509 RepID=A0A8I6Y287_HORVV
MNVLQMIMLQDSIMGDTSHLREMPGHRHGSLKTVKIIGFSSAKSLVELTCHIIENTTSLECLTLDTTRGHSWGSCLTNYTGKCLLLHEEFMVEARKGLLAIKTYVEPKVPSGVKLNVVEPCRRCNDLESVS